MWPINITRPVQTFNCLMSVPSIPASCNDWHVYCVTKTWNGFSAQNCQRPIWLADNKIFFRCCCPVMAMTIVLFMSIDVRHLCAQKLANSSLYPSLTLDLSSHFFLSLFAILNGRCATQPIRCVYHKVFICHFVFGSFDSLWFCCFYFHWNQLGTARDTRNFSERTSKQTNERWIIVVDVEHSSSC